MTEHPIGSIFTDPKYGLLEVVESDDCEGCAYDKGKLTCVKDDEIAGTCTGPGRNDGKYVKFIPTKMTDTRPVGSVFHHPEHGLLQVVESRRCNGCIFYNKAFIIPCQVDDTAGYCSLNEREDGKSVIFKQYTK